MVLLRTACAVSAPSLVPSRTGESHDHARSRRSCCARGGYVSTSKSRCDPQFKDRVRTRATERPTGNDRSYRRRTCAQKPDAVRIEVELTAVRYDADGKGVFTTSTGTVWRETVTSPVRSRLDSRRTYKGVITSGLMGGFRLNVEGVVRELKVEPIRTL